MGIQLLGLVLAPILCYFIWKEYYLNESEQILLISSVLMLLSLIFDGWITYLAYLVLIGWHAISLLSMSKLTYYFDRNKSTHNFSAITEYFFRLDSKQLDSILYAIIIWIWIRITTLKSLNYQFDGGNFITILKGWNCTFGQFWWINMVWTIICCLSIYSCRFLIEHESDRNNLYKKFIVNYKLIFDITFMAIITFYHLIIFIATDNLAQCRVYFNDSAQYIRLLWFWGIPLSTIYFFYKKHGQFSIHSNSSQAENGNDLEQKLNHEQIDRQHSKMSQSSEIALKTILKN